MLTSILVGAILGIIYGLSFFVTKKKALSSCPSKVNPVGVAAFSTVRLLFISLIFAYLLLQNILNYILVFVIFFISLWITIIYKSGIRLWKA